MHSRGQLEFCFPSPEDVQDKKGAMAKSGSESEAKKGVDQGLTQQFAVLKRALGQGRLAGKLVVAWNSRMRSTAGRAFWPEGKIELNPKLIDLSEDEVSNTLLHELAHLLAYARAGRKRIKAHGSEWRQACCDLGIPNERATHNLPLPSREMARQWRYTCPTCKKGIERVRKMKRYAGCYYCCKEHNGGYYHKKYRLVESRID
mgnify:CR=1 FL=1